MTKYTRNYILKPSPKGECKGCVYHSGMDCNILINNPESNGTKIGCVTGDNISKDYFIIIKSIKNIL